MAEGVLIDLEQFRRRERDLLGEDWVPAEAYFGIQTQRARNNFNLSGVSLSHFPQLVNALAMVKLACARANHTLGGLDETRLGAIDCAVGQILEGKYHDQFVADMIQGGWYVHKHECQ